MLLMRPLSIAVLGGSGFLGRHRCSRLIRDGHTVRVLTRNRDRHKALLVLPGLELLEADVHQQNVLGEAFRGCEVVVNLVGILNERSGASFARAHADLAAKVVTACRSAGVARLLHVSALGAAADAPSRYLRSKAAAERCVREDSGPVRWTILQPSVIFGPDDRFSNLFAMLLRISPVLSLPRAATRLQPIWVGDVVEACVRSLADPTTAGATFELGGPEVMTLADFVRCLRALLGLRRAVIALPAPLGWLQAAILGLLPGAPFSLDNYRSLARDSVLSLDGCARLGIRPARLASCAAGWLGAASREARLDAYRRAAGDRIGYP
jgi:uncharacterized protein YbjT (DUF2867 family)